MNRLKKYLVYIMFLALASGIGWCFLSATDRLEDGRASESKAQLERALRRAIAAEYAKEGAYPESLEQIVSKYGIQIDQDAYDVFYMPVAENLAPDLDVIEKGGAR